MGADLLCAWPQAEIGFMDPETAANVLFPGEADTEARDQRAREIALEHRSIRRGGRDAHR